MTTCVCAQEGSARCFRQHNRVLTIMAFLKRASNRTKGRKGIIHDQFKHTNQCQGLTQIITIYDRSNKVNNYSSGSIFSPILL